jgi:hypothetical protein
VSKRSFAPALALILLASACATAAEKEAAARERAYQQCLEDSRTHAMAWEAIEAKCREDAEKQPLE